MERKTRASQYQFLAKLWAEKRKQHELNKPEVYVRPKALRGNDMVTELIYWFGVTMDMRFRNAVRALHAHGVIDDNFHFTQFEGEKIEKLRAERDRLIFEGINELMKSGLSLRRSSAEFASGLGYKGNSFEAATKALERKYYKMRQAAQRGMSRDSE